MIKWKVFKILSHYGVLVDSQFRHIATAASASASGVSPKFFFFLTKRDRDQTNASMHAMSHEPKLFPLPGFYE